MSARPQMVHSQRRILATLKLAPMTREQLEECLMLHRTTVLQSLDALIIRRKVQRRVRGSAKCGAWPDVFSLVQVNSGGAAA